MACELLPKAEEYQLEGLKAKCEEALSKTLTVETVIDILLMADTHNAKNLKQSCFAFIAKNMQMLRLLCRAHTPCAVCRHGDTIPNPGGRTN